MQQRMGAVLQVKWCSLPDRMYIHILTTSIYEGSFHYPMLGGLPPYYQVNTLLEVFIDTIYHVNTLLQSVNYYYYYSTKQPIADQGFDWLKYKKRST